MCIIFPVSRNTFLIVIALIVVLLVSTHYIQQAPILFVCFYKMKEITVFSLIYSYVAVNRGTVINNT